MIRRFRLPLLVAASLVAVAFCLSLVLLPAQAGGGDDIRVTHGPMLGRPGADQMGVWVRTNRPGTVTVLYGASPSQLDGKAKLTTSAERDNTGFVILRGLTPNTRYHYRVATPADKPDRTFEFRTLPSEKTFANPRDNPRGLFNFRFEFACGNNQGVHSHGPANPTFKTMLTHLRGKIDFAILNGDWLYEDRRDFTVEEYLKQTARRDLPTVARVAPSIVGVWQNYKTYLERSPNLAAWHREIPSLYTFDDHEILNDVVGSGQAGYRDRRSVFRDIGVQAWYDYLGWSNPLPFTQAIVFGRAKLKAGSDVLWDASADFSRLQLHQAANLHVHWGTADAGVDDPKLDLGQGDPNAGVYDIVSVLDNHRLRIHPPARADGEAAYSIGRRSYFHWQLGNCDFFFLDTRSHRMKHDSRKPWNPHLTMLGPDQKAWLKTKMAKSNADFCFVVSSVNLTIPHSGTGGMSAQADDKDDAWTAFLHEREEMLRFWEGLGKPVFVLTGDLHNSFAVKVADHVWEFASGPHNSANHPTGSEGGRPASGPFNSKGRHVDIRWSTSFQDDTPRDLRRWPAYCVVQVNNIFPNPVDATTTRWIAYPRPQVVFQYYHGLTGDLMYAEAITAAK